MARYSLAKYLLTVSIPRALADKFGAGTITVGGEGSHTSSISIAYKESLWTTEGDSTGSWVHNKNLDRTGTATVVLNQLASNVVKFKTLCNIFYDSSEDYDGLTLTLTDSEGQKIATCEDCYITTIPAQEFGNTATTQNWEFTCGRITML